VGAANWRIVDDHTDAAIVAVARVFTALLSTASILLAVERTAYVALVVFGLEAFQFGEAAGVAEICVVAGWVGEMAVGCMREHIQHSS